MITNELETRKILEYHDYSEKYSDNQDSTPAWGLGTKNEKDYYHQETLLKNRQMDPNLSKTVQKYNAYIPVQMRKEIKRPNLTLKPSA